MTKLILMLLQSFDAQNNKKKAITTKDFDSTM